jgi:hypothetical protein
VANRQAGPAEGLTGELVVAGLSRPGAAGLVSVEEAGVDVAGLREEAAAIRVHLEERAGDRAVGKISRAQMLKGHRGGHRPGWRRPAPGWTARPNVPALLAAGNAAAAWAGLGISRKRAVINTLMPATLHCPGKGARRAFDPATVRVTRDQPDPAWPRPARPVPQACPAGLL